MNFETPNPRIRRPSKPLNPQYCVAYVQCRVAIIIYGSVDPKFSPLRKTLNHVHRISYPSGSPIQHLGVALCPRERWGLRRLLLMILFCSSIIQRSSVLPLTQRRRRLAPPRPPTTINPALLQWIGHSTRGVLLLLFLHLF